MAEYTENPLKIVVTITSSTSSGYAGQKTEGKTTKKNVAKYLNMLYTKLRWHIYNKGNRALLVEKKCSSCQSKVS